jgi:hypothetical protein
MSLVCRQARLVYHGNNAHQALVGPTIQCSLVVEDVHQGKYAGNRYLHIVYAPRRLVIPKPTKKEDKKPDDGKEPDTDKKDSLDKDVKALTAGVMSFSLSQSQSK